MCIRDRIFPYKGGRTAPPTMAKIKTAEPILVSRPKPVSASGKIAGHMAALLKPSKAKAPTATAPVLERVMITRIMLRTAEKNKALCCERYLGIKAMPTK